MPNPKGRPKGTHNRPGSLRTGPKPFRFAKSFTPQEVVDFKGQIISLIEREKAYTLTEAADQLGLPKTRVHQWHKADKEFAALVDTVEQIKADRLEKELAQHAGQGMVIAKMFLLKKLRPEYRENAKIEFSSEPLERLLKELKEVGQPKPAPVETKSKEGV